MADTLAILSDESLTIVIFFYDKGTFFSMKVGQMTIINISMPSEAFFANHSFRPFESKRQFNAINRQLHL